MRIPLAKDTINHDDIDRLSEWLETYPRLTKGELTEQFEYEWAKWLGTKYAVFVNSGSSANLLAIYAEKIIGTFQRSNPRIIVPAVSWATTVAPAIQFGLQPILCDANLDNLGVDLDHFERICKRKSPAAAIVVHVLGLPCDIVAIQEICDRYGVVLLEDCCEAIGSKVGEKKVGTFGELSTISTYFGHHYSSIEGGFISTDDRRLYNILKSIRSHGWSRDMDKDIARDLKEKYKIDDFHELYSFYYPGFNVRSTDLQAFIGKGQLSLLDNFVAMRNSNYQVYDAAIQNDFWKPKIPKDNFVSNLAYPIISPKIKDIVKKLSVYGVETRPLVAGSIGRQPFWIERYGMRKLPKADMVHDYGLYVPNYAGLSSDEVTDISNLINEVLNNG
jgi:CDP-4-dehydro-6-deoxyglucose reductase, E1